ncbi:MAG: ATP-binding protein [Labilithrix sp.]|nr:ATP-binding protein [Labilithrix sp.]
MPYRTARGGSPVRAPGPGIVDDMVRQFADRYAFLRELVQNGIDAGATRLEIRVERDPRGAVRTSVDDDGCGMTRKIIEGPLLTLFSSSKENDATKIGKYGIGFVSVFALSPDRVEVETRHRNEAWLVRLFGDHAYELLAGHRAVDGTTVTLVQTLGDDEFSAHAASVKSALRRWCRHARVPIRLFVDDGDAAGETINVPFSVPGLVTVSAREGDEQLVVSCGADPRAALPESAPTFAGFYNRGLTLMETTEVEANLEGIRFKVDSPRLSHTLSRDNVRRDDELRRVLRRVSALVRGALARELLARVDQAATEALTGSCASYAALLDAALAPGFAHAGARSPALVAAAPLVDEVDGARVMALADVRSASPVRVLVADDRGPITVALAARGQPVVRHAALTPLLVRIFGSDSVREASRALAYARADAKTRPNQATFLEALATLLRAAGRSIGRVRVASFHGLASEERCRVTPFLADDALGAPAPAHEQPWGTASTLFLNASDAMVRLALRRAKTDAKIAAHLMCRAILLAEGPLAEKQVDALLATVIRDG